MIRTQVQFEESQFEKIRLYAASQGISFAGVIRQSIDRFFSTLPQTSAPRLSELRPSFPVIPIDPGIADHDAGFVAAIEASHAKSRRP